MKKIIGGKIVDTDKGVTVALHMLEYGHRSIELIDGVYYLQTVGGNDIQSPKDDVEEIGAGCSESLLPYASGHDEWSRNAELIAHIEEVLWGGVGFIIGQ